MGITFAFNGIRTSCDACDIRRANGKLYSESLDDSGRRTGGGALAAVGAAAFMIGIDTSSCIILIDGASGPFVALAPSEGSRISIV